MITTVIVFFVLLSILVFVHELGHFLVAKWAGILVEEFGFGLPPRMIGKKFGETILSLNWLPIGGFVKLYGEDAESDEEYLKQHTEGSDKISRSEAQARSFQHKSKKVRAAILLAGVGMNFLLAVILTTVLLVSGVREPSGKVHVEAIAPNSPAQAAGLVVGDVITYITIPGEQTIALQTPKDLIGFVNDHKGQRMELTVIRNDVRQVLSMTPRTDVPPGEGPLGVAITDLETRKYSLVEAPGKAVTLNLTRAWEMLASLGTTLFNVITFKGAGTDIAGPIGIAQVTGQAVRIGWQAVLEFAALLSLNLAVLNLLPIPALDGGRLLFVILEKFLGRKVNPAFERSAHQWGMIVLLFLVALISLNDISRIARGG